MQKLYQLHLERQFTDLTPETCTKDVLKIRIDDVQKKAHVRSIQLMDFSFIDTNLVFRVKGGKEQIRKFLNVLYDNNEVIVADMLTNRLIEIKEIKK